MKKKHVIIDQTSKGGEWNCCYVWPFLFVNPLDINECGSNPCQNGGTCSNGNGTNKFVCGCVVGWTGARCETSKHVWYICYMHICVRFTISVYTYASYMNWSAFLWDTNVTTFRSIDTDVNMNYSRFPCCARLNGLASYSIIAFVKWHLIAILVTWKATEMWTF